MVPSWRQIVREVNAAPNLHDALALIAHRVKQTLPVDACAVYLTDPEKEQYVLMAAEGLDAAPAGTLRVDRQGLVGLVAERRELVVVTDAAARKSCRSSPEPGQGTHGNFLGMPLIHYRAVLGVLVAWKRVDRDFGDEEVIFFLTIAAHLAKAIHGASAMGEVGRMLTGENDGEAFVQGIHAAPGLAIGTAATLVSTVRLDSISDRRAEDTDAEVIAFRAAVADVQKELAATSDRLAPVLAKDVHALFDVYIMLLGDDGLVSDTVERIRAGSWAPGAWRDAIVAHARVFELLEDPYLRARADDIYEMGQRVLVRLGAEQRESREFPEHCILVGDTLGVTEIAAVPAGRLAGIVCMRGSALSHTAVLARALGIPAVVSVASLPTRRLDGCEMIVDGHAARIYVKPSHTVLEAFRHRARDENARSERLLALRDMPAVTPDGARLPLYANIGLASDIAAARRSGAEGVGLYRTEYPFLLREAFPIESEQYEIYRDLLEAFPQRPVTMRTLDVGGDKLLSYFPVQEDNPFLGCRGIRFSLDHPEIFVIQLRAMLRANAGLDNLQVLLPMIGTVGEVDEALALLARAHRELLEAGLASSRPRVGIMIEVPAAVYLTSAFAERVDFFSIGTNDLTQYMLAADRNNAQVTTPYDSLHPSILAAIGHVVEAAHLRGKQVSVCGEMAGDPAGALLLLGMGVDVLSMSPMSLPQVKLAIRSFTLLRARALVEAARGLQDGFAIHRLLHGALDAAGV